MEKNAQPHNNAELSANHTANSIGQYPQKLASVSAAVLRRLLQGERLTSLTTVFDSSTTRLAAVVHYLENEYGWAIDRTDIVVGTRDGRVTVVSEYFLKAAVIATAFAADAATFCADVEHARARQRQQADNARAEAVRRNTRFENKDNSTLRGAA